MTVLDNTFLILKVCLKLEYFLMILILANTKSLRILIANSSYQVIDCSDINIQNMYLMLYQ